MVDFNNETTITTDRSKIVTVIILQRHSFVIDALESYNKFRFSQGNVANPHKATVMSAILSLWLQLRANVYESGINHEDKPLGVVIDALLQKPEFKDFYRGWLLIDEFVCGANLTRFYYSKSYSPRNTFDELEARMS